MKEMIKYVVLMLLISTIFVFAAKNANAWGTGHFISNDGYLLTNRHVTDNALVQGGPLTVIHNNIHYPAKLVYIDKAIDLALLKIEAVTPCLKIGDYKDTNMKGKVLTGVFYDFRKSYNQPKVITKPVTIIDDRNFYADGMYKGTYTIIPPYIRPGNSGSPLINYQNYIVAVYNSGYTEITRPDVDTVLIKQINSGAVSNGDLVSVKNANPQVHCHIPTNDPKSIINTVNP